MRIGPYQYRKLFPALISNWRQGWGQGDFPFVFVQLPNYAKAKEGTWSELRESQLKALELPNTGMAIAIDIGDPENIHPPNKLDLGKRLTLAVRAAAVRVQRPDLVGHRRHDRQPVPSHPEQQ